MKPGPLLCILVSSLLPAQTPVREEPVDLDVAIANALQTVSARTGERVVQDMEVRVTRRNNRRPVAAGLLVRVRTPGSGPSATFGRSGSNVAEFTTDAEGKVHIQGLLTNQTPGKYRIDIEVDSTDADGTHYSGNTSVNAKNVKGGTPGWVKYAAIAAGAGVIACVAGPCRSNNSGPNATIGFGPARVAGR